MGPVREYSPCRERGLGRLCYRFSAGRESFCAGFAGRGPFSSKKTSENSRFPAPRVRRAAVGQWCDLGRAAGLASHPPVARRSLPRAEPRQMPARRLGRLMGRVEPPARLHPRCATIPRRQQKPQRRAPAAPPPPPPPGAAAAPASGPVARSGPQPPAARSRRAMPPPSTTAGPRAGGLDEDQAAGVDLLPHAGHVEPVGMPGGPDPQDCALPSPAPATAPAAVAWGRRTHACAPPPAGSGPEAARLAVLAIGRAGEAGEIHGIGVMCSLFVLKGGPIALPSAPGGLRSGPTKLPAGTDRCAAYRSAPPT
jgi:hypothetical protein